MWSTRRIQSGNHGLVSRLGVAAAVASALLLAWPQFVSAQSAGTTFYHDAKRGWFWYEDPAPEDDLKEVAEIMPSPAPPTTMRDFTIDELWDMHPDDFHDLLMATQKEAVRQPTEENVLDYIRIQDIARRKAAAFANVSAYVTQKHSEFDLARDYPTAAPGARARVSQQHREIEETISRARRDHALIYFTNPDCSYCVEQDQILGHFTVKHGWEVRAIDIRSRPDVAVQFGIQTTPALLLIKQGNADHIPVAVGVVAVNDLERRLYRAIRMLRGDIGPEEFSMYDFQRGGAFDPGAIRQIDNLR